MKIDGNRQKTREIWSPVMERNLFGYFLSDVHFGSDGTGRRDAILQGLTNNNFTSYKNLYDETLILM